MILDPWQEEALKWDGDLLLCTGRQVGKTLILARKSAKWMLEKPGTKIVCCSLTEDQAKLIIVMTLDFLQKNHPKDICTGLKKPTSNKIYLKNGSEMLARPVGTTGDAVRGFTGNVLILDEVSRFNEMILTAAKPILMTTGGKIWAASTPFGKKGFFYESYLNKNNRFKVLTATSWDVVHNRPLSEDWTKQRRAEAIAFLESERRDMSALAFGQEYLGLFVEDLSRYFSDELINKACTLDQSEPVAFENGQTYLGIDVASFGKDESTFIVLSRSEDKMYMRQIYQEITNKTFLDDTFKKAKTLNEQYNPRKIYVDDGGIGLSVFQSLMNDTSTRFKTIPLNNASRSISPDDKQKKKILKEDLYENLRWLMESGRIQLFNNENLKASLTSIQYNYNDKKEIKIFGSYSHLTEALDRAAHGYSNKSLNLW